MKDKECGTLYTINAKKIFLIALKIICVCVPFTSCGNTNNEVNKCMTSISEAFSVTQNNVLQNSTFWEIDDLYYELECQETYTNYETADRNFDCIVNVGKSSSAVNIRDNIDFVILNPYGFPLQDAELFVKENYFDDNLNDDIRFLGIVDYDGSFVWENPTRGRHLFFLVDSLGNSYFFKLEINETVVKAIITLKEDSFLE